MAYFINIDTNSEFLYHGSKKGIQGHISPNYSALHTDFGNGFYLGTKEIQTLSRIVNEVNPLAYKFKIDSKYINDENTISLEIRDWFFFVLYNRGKLEDLKGTAFYEKYAHLADGKDFIIGPIADDVYGKCVDDFCEGRITDWTFCQLIDCFAYGLQVVAKTQRACECLELVSEKSLTVEDRKLILSRRLMTKKERFAFYDTRVSELNLERKGNYFIEIKTEIS